MLKMKRVLGILLAAVMVISSCIPITTKAAESVTLTFGGASIREGNKDYLISLGGLTTDQVNGLGANGAAKVNTILIDGKKCGGYGWNSGGTLIVLMNWTLFNENATSAADVGRHFVTIPKGSTIGTNNEYTVAEDITFFINGDKTPTKVEEFVSLGYKSTTDRGNDFLNYLTGFTATELDALGANGMGHDFATGDLLVDGVATSEPYLWNLGSGNLAFIVNDEHLEATATTTAGVTQKHLVTIQKGAKIGKYTVDRELTLRIGGGSVEWVNPNDGAPTLSIAATNNTLLLLKADEIEAPIEDLFFEAVDSSAVFQYNGVASQRPFIYSKHGGIYADVAGMTGVAGQTAAKGDVITIKGLWRYPADHKIYDFGITNYSWNGTEWVEGIVVDAETPTLKITANRTDLLMLAIDGVTTPTGDTNFEAVDANSVYRYNDINVSRMFYSKFNGIYSDVYQMSGKGAAGAGTPDAGDTITIGGVWKYLGNGKYYDFGTTSYIWNGKAWAKAINIETDTVKPTLSITANRTDLLMLGIAEITTPTADTNFEAYDASSVYRYNDTNVSRMFYSKFGGIYSDVYDMSGKGAAGAGTPDAGDTITIGGVWKYLGDNKYYNFETTTYVWTGAKWEEQVEQSEFTLVWGTDAKADDPNTRYFTYTTGATAEQAEAMHQKRTTIYVDGNPVENGVEFFKDGTQIILLIPYATLESGVTTAEAMQPHNLQLKAGTVINNCKLMNDLNFYVNKTEIAEGTYSSSTNDVTLAYSSGAAQEPNGTTYTGKPRYCLYFTGLSDEQITAYTKPTIYIDGVAKTHADLGIWGSGDKILLTVPYEVLEENVTDRWDFQKTHTVWIKEGTMIADTYTVKNDVMIELNKNTITDVSAKAANKLELSIKSLSASDTYKRYDVALNGIDKTKLSGFTRITLYVDGVAKTHNDLGIWPYDDYGLLTVPYDVLESGVTTYAGLMSPHSLQLKSGTIVGDYMVAEDINVATDGEYIKDTSTLTEVNFDLLAMSAAQDSYANGNPAKRYLLYLSGVTGDQIAELSQKKARLNVDDTKRTSDPYFWDTLEDGSAITLILDYTHIEENVEKASDFASDHMITIKKGTILANKYVVGEDLMVQLNKYSVTKYVAPDLIEPEVKDAVTTSVDGTVLTVNGTGTIKASDLASVTAASITEIKIEGPCNIDSQAFAGFTALQKVYFSNTVLTAAADAFSGCASGVKAIFVKGRSLTGGLANVENHEYYSFKILTLGSSYGEDTNNYIYTLAKHYYSNLPGRTAEDIAYDDIVVAELFSGGCPLSDRVLGIMGQPATTCYYEKWDENGAVIPTVPTGQLTGDLMKMALQDEYWDVVILMQSAEDSRKASSFLVSTAGNGVADIDTVINFAKANNKNHSGSKYMWLQTWSYNYKLNAPDNYADAIGWEEDMRNGIKDSMQTVVQERIDMGGLDGIVPAGASIEYLKKSFLNAEDPNYTSDKTSGTYNNGIYSNYFAIQRDTAHASIGLGRFALGLTAFGYLADLKNAEIQALANKCYPKNYAECEVSEKLEGEQAPTSAYLLYDEYTKDCAPQAYSAAIKALADPYMEGAAAKIYKTGDANGDDAINALDLIRYKKAQTGAAQVVDEATTDMNMDGTVDAVDLKALRAWFVK